MIDKDKFLKRKFLYDMQHLIAFFATILIWFLIAKLGFFVGQDIFDISYENMLDIFWVQYGGMSVSLIFGLYNLFTYFYSKKLAEKYGIEMFGDLDQDWLIEYQGYDAKVFGEIYSKLLYFRKLGAQSLFITIPLSFTPWPAVPLIVGIVMIVFYILYKQVYFYQALGDRWPRVFAGGTVISRIINGEKGKLDINGDKHGK